MPIIRDPFSEDATSGAVGNHEMEGWFTDREAERAAFRRLLAAPENTVMPVLHFYGVGGAGKSSLLDRLSDEVQAELAPDGAFLPLARTDFADRALRDPVSRLTELRTSFARSSGIGFPRFDVALAVLAAKRGGPEEGLVEVDGWLQALFSVVEGISGAPLSSAKEVAGHLFRKLRSRYPELESGIRRIGGTEQVISLRRSSPAELESALVRRFAADLLEGAPRRPDRACHAIIFFDTYERLWENSDGPMSPQGLMVDAWVRDLYGFLAGGGVLIVIAGRDELQWERLDEAWGNHIERYLIGGLSCRDTQICLAKRGIGPLPEQGEVSELQSAIIKCTSGGDEDTGCSALFVAICADIVRVHRDEYSANPPPEWFNEIPSNEVAVRLTHRFMASLTGSITAERLQFLAAGRWFDEKLLLDRVGGDPDAAAAEFRTLRSFSFTEEAGDGRVRLHAVMRNALLYIAQREDPERLRKHHDWFGSHWRSRSGADATAEIEWTYHSVASHGMMDLDWTEDLHRIVLSLIERGLMARAQAHVDAATEGWSDAPASSDRTPALLLYLSSLLLDKYTHKETRDQQLETASRCIDEGDLTIGRCWIVRAQSSTARTERDRLSKLREALRLAEADGDRLCQSVVLRRMAWVHCDDNEYLNNVPTLQNALMLSRDSGFVAGEANCLCDLARAWIDGDGGSGKLDPVAGRDAALAAIEVSRHTQNPGALMRGYHNLGRALLALGEYEAADKALDDAIATLSEYARTGLPSPLLRRKAIIRRLTQRYAEGIELVEQALEYDTESGNREGVVLAYAELARLLEKTGRRDAAVAAAEHARRLAHEFGVKHPTEGPEDLDHLRP